MRDERDEIRSRINIVDLVAQKVLLKRAGKNWKGLCPFHEDRNPSFLVNADYGSYRCWSCGERGDVFTWVMKTQNVEFGEALRLLADQAGVPLKGKSPQDATQRARRLTAMQAAQAFFLESLAANPQALAYCESRGLDAFVRAQWGIGFAPSGDAMLAARLKREGLSLAEAKELFLVEDDGTGSYFDKFRGRLMFPIHDERGDHVAYGGRILGDGHPKYINSSDTPLYRKSKVLYGMHLAKEAIGKSHRAVLVEGYLDVIACHRAGVGTAVASLGTSLAEDQVRLFKRWCDEVVILYDSDSAGVKAAKRACEMLVAEGLRVSIALMPPGEDPDTLLRTAGPEAVQRAVEAGITPAAFRIRMIEQHAVPGSDDFWQQLVDAIADAASLSEVERHIAYVSGKYLGGRRSAEESLLQRVRAAQREKLKLRKKVAKSGMPNAPIATLPPAEALLLRAYLEEDLRFEAQKALRSGLLQSEAGKSLWAALDAAFPEKPPIGKAGDWLGEIEPEEARNGLIDLGMEAAESAPLVRRARGNVTAGELADAMLALVDARDRREREQARAQPTDEALVAAQESLQAKHSREASRWED